VKERDWIWGRCNRSGWKFLWEVREKNVLFF
jgi:hypothetical protein